MNIAFVLSYWADSFGGPVTAVRGLGEKLAELGDDVSYWAVADEGELEDCDSIGNVHVYPLDGLRSWRCSRAFAHAIEAGIDGIDLVHVNGFWLHPSYAAGKAARKRGIPYILRPAGCLEPWRLRNGRLRRLKKAAYLWLMGDAAMKNACCLHADSTQEAEHFRQAGYNGPVVVIPNGIEMSQFDDGDADVAETYWPMLKNRPVIVFMSRLSPEKGLDLLIPAWAELARAPRYRDAVLVIAGPDDRGYQRVLEEMIDGYGVRSRICMIGMVRGQEKLALLRRADIFVLPSYSENFGIVVAEALACGTPVITTTGTPWEQLHAVDAGRWVAPTKDQIGQVLRELLDMSESQRRQMGARGAALIREQYTWEHAARKFLTVCDCILEGKSIPLHPEPKELKTL